MQPNKEDERTQQAVWAAMRVRSLLQQTVAGLDKFYERYPELEGLLHARTYGSSIAGIQDGFLGGLQLLLRKLPSPVADAELPIMSEHDVPIQAMGAKSDTWFHLRPTGVPDGPTVATIAVVDEDHVALVVPCQTDGCTGRVEGVAYVGSTGPIDTNAVCPKCKGLYRLDYQFGSYDIRITTLVPGEKQP